MEISEKELEDYLEVHIEVLLKALGLDYENDGGRLHYERQRQLGDYGIVDFMIYHNSMLIAVELKKEPLQLEHILQISRYMNAILTHKPEECGCMGVLIAPALTRKNAHLVHLLRIARITYISYELFLNCGIQFTKIESDETGYWCNKYTDNNKVREFVQTSIQYFKDCEVDADEYFAKLKNAETI